MSVPLLVGASVVGLDQATKHWATATLGGQTGPAMTTLGGWLSFDYTLNRGAAFGVMAGSDVLFVVVAVMVVLVMVAGIIWYPARRHSMLFSIGLQLGGAAGNLIDRVRLGYVVDFIYVKLFPVFNLADTAIVTGAALLAWVWLHPDTARPNRVATR